jgi:formate dehydrogenase iron-sulfur subunit
VCPVGALVKTPEGPVTYDADKCIGCRYCMVACPFGIPKYQWGEALPKVQKCIMCAEKRVSKGLKPACATVCPSGATTFGERDALIAEARKRIRSTPNEYVDHVYGLEEAGGTSVLYLSCVPFESIGFPTGVQDDAYPKLTWNILSKIPNIVSTGGVVMFGIWWIVNRRMQLAGENGSGNTHAGEEG